MKTVFNNSEDSNFELVKRFIYSLQVLSVVVSIPLLFVIGISHDFQNKSNETEIKEFPIQLTIIDK